jgi:hypothetical protein
MTLAYYASPANVAKPPKGQFLLDVKDVEAAVTNEHKRKNEVVVKSKGRAMYAVPDSEADVHMLLAKIDAARRLKVAASDASADDKPPVYLSEADLKLGPPVAPGELGAKVFSCGVGSLLGLGNQTLQGVSVPQRVSALNR